MVKEKYGMILIALFVPIFLLIGMGLPAQYKESFLGELSYKYEALSDKGSEKPRLILLGGSSVAFGVDSALMEEWFSDYEVINFGMYAALGTKLMLDLSRNQVREGDIVVVMPEQQAQTLSLYFNAEATWQALDGSWEMLRVIPRVHWGSLAGAWIPFVVSKWNYFLSGEQAIADGIYRRSSFDENGDIVSELCQANVMFEGYDSNGMISVQNEVVDLEFVNYLNDYRNELKKKNVQVYYHFCPMNALAVADKDRLEEYYLYLVEQLDCMVLGMPQDCMLEAGWFYDTNFHLNSSGKIVFTKQLIQDLKAMFGDTRATNIVLPEMPVADDSIGVEIPVADDSVEEDAKYFLFEEKENGLILVGLTEEGKKKESLIVPTQINGKRVRELSSTVFAQDEQIQQIILQKGLRKIADKAFVGCSHLEEIELREILPSELQVGQDLLEGTNAILVVEKEHLTAFRLDYTWSLYAQRIQSKE